MGTLLFILGIILFILLIVVHELGHAIAAKRNGVVVEEFGIGFPPRAWAKKLKNGVLFTLNWLPLGGFVSLKGESDDSKVKGGYGQAPLWAKVKILLAGVVMNWLTAIAIFMGLALTGMPQILANQFTIESDTRIVSQKAVVAQVSDDSPAAAAGLQQGDVIKQLADRQIAGGEDLVGATTANAGEEVRIVYERAGEQREANVTLREAGTEGGVLGVAPGEQTLRASTWSAPIVAVGVTAQFTWETLKGLGAALGNLFAGIAQSINVFSEDSRKAGSEALTAAGASVAGPVGIVGFLMQTAENAGLAGVLFIIAILSLTLALMNALPIPALDGGRLFVMLLFRAMKKPLKSETEQKIHATGFLVLISLIIVITFVDVGRLGG